MICSTEEKNSGRLLTKIDLRCSFLYKGGNIPVRPGVTLCRGCRTTERGDQPLHAGSLKRYDDGEECSSCQPTNQTEPGAYRPNVYSLRLNLHNSSSSRVGREQRNGSVRSIEIPSERSIPESSSMTGRMNQSSASGHFFCVRTTHDSQGVLPTER